MCGHQRNRLVKMEKKGIVLNGHKHVRDHVMTLHTGKVYIYATCDAGCKKDVILVCPGDTYNVPKDWMHEIIALTNDVAYTCSFERLNVSGGRWEEGQEEDVMTDKENI